MNKYERYIKNRSKKNTRFLIMVFLVFILTFFLTRAFNKNMNRQRLSLKENITETNTKISKVKKEIDTIKKDYENRNTDDFKEKIAREKLGMIKKDEYVYKDENNK
ncbi:FtsB family cell division protein [Anaerococcus hydrogenalis]|uniref:Septum formation initiator n=1 Tax=Anaerococcus hydrogenalis TaxID=33029 RepID=A0A2N6UKG7_9FIRM|nr:septum formation initiator family protein [Anaerococcus hydrogenalis]MDK7694254.1 septum formation initiator family protein [Anaerococcus hydrogenalis]MDK7696032.1 septum formation initiator family protein [Anaerococcus hydrogenalis]MDK7707281.1 septum formation initiator family protein [Anaerococcus hydrogenalis]PMC82307.1 septum formation initiator [Anaerococcus hydrogenalis]